MEKVLNKKAIFSLAFLIALIMFLSTLTSLTATAETIVDRGTIEALENSNEVEDKNEKKSDFKKRTADVQHPLMEKLFNEIAPKYAQRKEELGQGGGYTRIYLSGSAPRRRCRRSYYRACISGKKSK